MTKIKLILLIFIFISLACGKTEKSEKVKEDNKQLTPESTTPGNKIVALVDSKPIYEKDISDRKLEWVIADEILFQTALMQGLDKDEKIKKR